jgi:acyl-coenzyme A synthetase/AMP-(fatty) acid ligase
VENCLLRHSAVAECAVVGYEERGLVLPRAFVVLRGATESDELATELQEFVRAELSPHKYPRDIRFVAGLPKTASGKIDRRMLKDAERPATAASTS